MNAVPLIFPPLSSLTPAMAQTEFAKARYFLSNREDALRVLPQLAQRYTRARHHGCLSAEADIPTRLWEAAELNGLVEEHGEDTVYNVMMSAIQAAEDRPNEDADKPRPIAATQYEWKDPSTITRRDWLYRHLLIRKFVTATVSPGGVGKSSLIAVEALAKVSGKDLLGVTPWQWPDPLAGMTGADFDKAAAAIKAGRWRDNSQAKDWAGKAVADALGLDISDRRDKAKVAGMIKAWLAAGSLIKVEGMDEKRMPKMFIEVCESS
jgi:hypothetical protein